MSQSAPTAPRTGPRTLAEQLRGWPDASLVALLEARPDLAGPAPQDSAQLASRASTRASVLRALDRLDRLELTVLDALVALDGRGSVEALGAVVNAAPDRFAAALASVRGLALVWGSEEELRLVSAVSDVLGTTVSGLGPPAAQLLTTYGPDRLAGLLEDLGERSTGDRAADAERLVIALGDPRRVRALLEPCDEAAVALLEHLQSSGAAGASEATASAVRVASARTPVEQLLARGLLLPRDPRHLVVPREVGIALRGGRTTRDRVDQPPPLVTAERPARQVDQAAAGAAYELVHRVELLLDHIGEHPPPALRQGGLSRRDLRGLAALLAVDDRVAALHVEVAAAARLLALGSTADLDTVWLPTDAYDAWRAAAPADRWGRLVVAWLGSPRLFGLVGGRLQDKPVNALVPDLERSWVVDARRGALAELAKEPPGSVLASGDGVTSLVARMGWLRPRRPGGRAQAVAWAVEEAAVVGLMGLGGMSGHGRAALRDVDEGTTAATAVIAALLPKPVDHVLLQGDLTAVAPGPLEDSLARDLAVVAQVESRGGATVYRFTAGSVRHAFDLGWSAADVRRAVTRAARTAVPQPLEYLIDDVARTFGRIRVGAAEAFLRSDDEAALAALAHDPRAGSLRLRLIAPTVLVSGAPLDVLLPRLRELGASPVVEGPDGVVHVARPEPLRARTPQPGPHETAEAARGAARTSATVTAIRAGDRAADIRPTSPAARQSPAAALALLRDAVESGTPVWIGYVDKDGSNQDRLVDPQRVDGGWLRALDQRSEEVRSFAVHRISSVRRTVEP